MEEGGGLVVIVDIMYVHYQPFPTKLFLGFLLICFCLIRHMLCPYDVLFLVVVNLLTSYYLSTKPE